MKDEVGLFREDDNTNFSIVMPRASLGVQRKRSLFDNLKIGGQRINYEYSSQNPSMSAKTRFSLSPHHNKSPSSTPLSSLGPEFFLGARLTFLPST